MQPYDRTTAQVGDWISRPSVLPSLTWITRPSPNPKPRVHHGVVVAIQDNEVIVYELNEGGYRALLIDEFAEGKPVTLVARGGVGGADAVYGRALETTQKDREWSLFWTCENVAAYVHDGRMLGPEGQGMEEVMAAHDLGRAFAQRWKKR